MKFKNLMRSVLLALVVLGLATVGTAQAPKNGTKQTSKAQKGKDKDRDPNTDNDKNKGKHKGETQGKHKGATQGEHKAKGHSH